MKILHYNILEKFGDKIEYCDYDLKYTIKRIGECSEFIGADSGMAWLAAFHRVKTKILLGKTARISNTFRDIPWVSIEVEQQKIYYDINTNKQFM